MPHPKEAIIAAIESEIVREPHEARVDWLKTGALFLWNFQEGVGATPLPLTGVDLSKLPMGTTPAEINELSRNPIRCLDQNDSGYIDLRPSVVKAAVELV